jgi:hypothetical protein
VRGIALAEGHLVLTHAGQRPAELEDAASRLASPHRVRIAEYGDPGAAPQSER